MKIATERTSYYYERRSISISSQTTSPDAAYVMHSTLPLVLLFLLQSLYPIRPGSTPFCTRGKRSVLHQSIYPSLIASWRREIQSHTPTSLASGLTWLAFARCSRCCAFSVQVVVTAVESIFPKACHRVGLFPILHLASYNLFFPYYLMEGSTRD